jgi:hypothetical protein
MRAVLTRIRWASGRGTFEFERPHAFLPCPLARNLTSLTPFLSLNAGQAVDIKASKGASGRGPAPVGRILPQKGCASKTALQRSRSGSVGSMPGICVIEMPSGR